MRHDCRCKKKPNPRHINTPKDGYPRNNPAPRLMRAPAGMKEYLRGGLRGLVFVVLLAWVLVVILVQKATTPSTIPYEKVRDRFTKHTRMTLLRNLFSVSNPVIS